MTPSLPLGAVLPGDHTAVHTSVGGTAGLLLSSQVCVCCSFPPGTPLLPDGDRLSGEEVELVRRWRSSAGIWEAVSLPGWLLEGRGEVLVEEGSAQLQDDRVQGLCQKRACCVPWGWRGERGPWIRAPESGHQAAGPLSVLDLWSSRLGHRCEACLLLGWLVRLGQREGLRVWGGLSRCGKSGVGVASELRQQQGGDTQERGKSEESALLLSEISDSLCDPDTDSLCM